MQVQFRGRRIDLKEGPQLTGWLSSSRFTWLCELWSSSLIWMAASEFGIPAWLWKTWWTILVQLRRTPKPLECNISFLIQLLTCQWRSDLQPNYISSCSFSLRLLQGSQTIWNTGQGSEIICLSNCHPLALIDFASSWAQDSLSVPYGCTSAFELCKTLVTRVVTGRQYSIYHFYQSTYNLE